MKLRRRKCIPSCASHQRVDEDDLYWDGKKREEESASSHNSAHVITQLAQCFTNAMVGPRAWIGGFFSRSSNRKFGSDNYTLTPIQEERLQRLQERLGVPFDETRTDHQEALRDLWDAAFPNVKLKGLISEQWKDMGWQGANPSTDFRGCGFVSLENLLYFARTYPVTFNRLLLKQVGSRAEWEYPFAVAGINVSFMLIQMLDLHSVKMSPTMNSLKLVKSTRSYCPPFRYREAKMSSRVVTQIWAAILCPNLALSLILSGEWLQRGRRGEAAWRSGGEEVTGGGGGKVWGRP
ncbi:UNVERIFIED_CONTAM: ELMO domain-containing protein A [Sesamum radiatum]|uniref:ELMO domain-containing protein A n=1 Tax=Sesamum radiatum TaxID=300843 RepID=A0AAW2K4N4_SESRA